MTKQIRKTEIIQCLSEIKGGGKFVTNHSTGFIFPGLQVNGVGEISYPINETQALALIKAAHKAPFGKGNETLLDDKVRNTWEIDPAELQFSGTEWEGFLEKIIKKIKPELGLEGYSISAHLYKMLVYEKGGFFLAHKDSEKEKGMFGTLIIGLPSKHTGGELVIRFDGEEKKVSFEEDGNKFKIPYIAFYADCEHEIRPVTSGYRICLVYNLIQNSTGKKVQLQARESAILKLGRMLKDTADEESPVPNILLLGHQYTPENFTKASLKLNDRAKADILFRAAEKIGYYAALCLVTSYVSGAPAYSGYDEDDEDADMDEVFDESLGIEHWEKSGPLPLLDVKFEEQDLIVSFNLKEDEPIVKESTGYMGNYGPDLMHWYHYGAMIIWSKAAHEKLLLQQNDANKLEWIDYYNKNLHQLTEGEIIMVENILFKGLGESGKSQKLNYNVIADWVINRQGETFFHSIEENRLQFYFTKIDVQHWVNLFAFFPVETASKIITKITKNSDLLIVTQLFSILRALTTNTKFDELIAAQMKALPRYLSESGKKPLKEPLPVNNIILRDIFYIESKRPQDTVWVNNMAILLTKCKKRSYINTVLVPEIIALTEKTKLAQALRVACQQDLQRRADNKPRPPANWTRKMPAATGNQKEWLLLKDFLESPTEQVYNYQKNQNERYQMENAIQNVTIDLKIETIRKGSPHTLRITKTQAAYQREMKAWNEDVALLKKISNG